MESVVQVIADLPPGAPEQYGPCPRCGEAVDRVRRDVYTPVTWPESPTKYTVPYDQVILLPCGDEFDLSSAQLASWSVHVAEDAHLGTKPPSVGMPISPYVGGSA